ncbi:hypothetical protein [Micromonospora narathiwatensis]|uniref:Uncharacterized protein n=1 Tax=Micromonospora narathiwatensis TaxID=299146 RepID=A0A1A8ZA04_9ACTN|nr:hypothetical protein [Micromonospora narathiwatensis]SBT40797.1 hypothetical protein GA0070621_1063 [Micromonospora narathiwatensis]
MTTTASAAALTVLPEHGAGAGFRLSDLLARYRDGENKVFVSDAVLHHGTRDDPLLYTAHRDVLPRRHALDTDWFADLVEYQPGVLPGGELHRSTGHWNTPAQLEVFQTLTGRTLMITAWRTAAGQPVLRYQECHAGALAVIPFGGWHLTLVLEGPAEVFNIYAELPVAGNPTERVDCDADKYRRALAVEITAVRASDGFQLTGAGLAAWGTARQAVEPTWLRQALGAASLPEFYSTAHGSALAALARYAHRHLPAHTPDRHEAESR